MAFWLKPKAAGAVLVWAALTLAGPAVEAENVLCNPGFEAAPLGATGNPIYGWSWFGQEWNTLTQVDPAHARTGSNYFKAFGAFTTSYNNSGGFQEIPCTVGSIFTAESWFFSLSADGGGIHGSDQVWLEVTFRDSMGRALALYRSDVLTGGNIGSYGGLDHWCLLKATNQWSFYNPAEPVAASLTNTASQLQAPAGTAFVRYQLTFRQGPDNANGSAYFDDCILNQVSGTAKAWNIVWSDEFEGPSVDTTKWNFEIGNANGWGNNEAEYYTSWPQNAYVSNGVLNIVARRTNYAGFSYTSARMTTQGKLNKTYGRFEFRGRLPAGWGYWPAFWLLGANFPSRGWPACGEVDVMENRGSNLQQVQGTVHYADSAGSHLQDTDFHDFYTPNAAADFHCYTLEWTTNMMRWYVDGHLYQTRTNWSTSYAPYPAPFNAPAFLIMNLAVGGNYITYPAPSVALIDSKTTFPGFLQVDYVRVYDITAPLKLSLTTSAGRPALTWPASIVCHMQAQTNTVGQTGLWTDVPRTTNPFPIPPNPANASVFYRLRSP